ncbi:MAG: HDOD domain-containing protein [Methylophilaceae bacterium]|nr:HDOD domain-containing protein [Methylophilaceae bacterium]
MAFNPDHLLQRSLVIDRNVEVAFCRLSIPQPEAEVLRPLMLHLANADVPHMTYLLPLGWVDDALLFKKLAKNTVLALSPVELSLPLVGAAREAGYRIAIETDDLDATLGLADFYLVPYSLIRRASPDAILTGVDTFPAFMQARDTGALYFEGRSPLDIPLAAKPSINPSHAIVLELISAVQKEAEPKEIEAIFKRDVTLSFKLLRYINSASFGLMKRIESVRHALSIIGYQTLLKWLSLLAATAGSGASPALTQSAMTRARLMEMLGAKLMERRDQDNLFITGMFSLLDRIMQLPLDNILARVNLPEGVIQALLRGEGRYARFLALAQACEGSTLPAGEHYADLDVKAVNLAHLDAIEWAARLTKP